MNKDIKLIAITSLLAFLGATAGTFISNKYTDYAWERDISYKERSLIFNERAKLIERSAKIFAHLDEVKKNLALMEIERKRIHLADKYREKAPEEKDNTNDLTNRSIELKAEYTAVISMCSLYFGPKTLVAINELSKSEKWYDPDKNSVKEFFGAISEELYWFKS